jgi:hypothetical protein
VFAFQPAAQGDAIEPKHFLWLFVLILAGAVVAVLSRLASSSRKLSG